MRYRFWLYICLLFVYCLYIQNINAGINPFRMQTENQTLHLECNMNTVCNDSILISDSSLPCINSFSISGKIIQKSEDSFVRVLLEDTEGRDFLVMESCRMYNDVDTFYFESYCEETKYLPAMNPHKLKVFVTNANVILTDMIMSVKDDKERVFSQVEQQKILKANKSIQQLSIVERINKYNIKHKALWRADTNYVTLLPWEKRKIVLGITDNGANTGGIEYYAEGIFEVKSLSANVNSLWSNNLTSTVYVDSFDWRNRHGKNWMTPVKHQGATFDCWAFSAVGAVESVTNLYFNQKLDLDLSEQELVSCSRDTIISHLVGSSSHNALQWITNNGVIDENAFPFNKLDSLPCSEKSDDYSECLSIAGFRRVRQVPDSLRKYLIHNGPMTISYRVSENMGHAVVLTGFDKLKVGDGVKIPSSSGPNESRIQEGDSEIGKTYWICKNSYGTNQYNDGYIKLYFPGPQGGYSTFYIQTPVVSMNYSDDDIVVSDADGDGFYFWGLGPKPAHCPDWVPDIPDGDDSDYTKGPMDEYGRLRDLDPDLNDTIFINTDSVCSKKKFIYNHTVIKSGASLTLRGQTTFYRDATLTVEDGASFVVDAAYVKDADISVKPGGDVKVINNGVIRGCKGKDYILPLGASMEVNNGIIFTYE